MSEKTLEKLLPLKKALEDLCHANCNICPFGIEENQRYICSILQHFQTLEDGITYLNGIAPTVIQEILNEFSKKGKSYGPIRKT